MRKVNGALCSSRRSSWNQMLPSAESVTGTASTITVDLVAPRRPTKIENRRFSERTKASANVADRPFSGSPSMGAKITYWLGLWLSRAYLAKKARRAQPVGHTVRNAAYER